jgi:hypothetical protein
MRLFTWSAVVDRMLDTLGGLVGPTSSVG